MKNQAVVRILSALMAFCMLFLCACGVKTSKDNGTLGTEIGSAVTDDAHHEQCVRCDLRTGVRAEG